ncbi:MAG: dockerin type I repeat-containing protein [Clostridia bacterium]|nr:dockerin type I repeat-containing protein [Clostridia bacterium]
MKRLKSLPIAAVAAMIIFIVSVISGAALFYGDVNKNGKVQSNDARTILRHAARLEMITDEEAYALADINGDGKVNSIDARLALRMASRLEPTVVYPEATTASELPSVTLPPVTLPPVPSVPTSAETTTQPVPTLPAVTTTAPVTVPEETTTAPVEPTTVPEETTTAPVEPTTVPEETTTAPVEPTTVPAEPTTAPAEPSAYDTKNVVTHDKFYMDADMRVYENGQETSMSLKMARGRDSLKGVTKTENFDTYYVRTMKMGPDMGILITKAWNTALKLGTHNVMYLINYDAKEYVELNSDVLKLIPGLDLNVDDMVNNGDLAQVKIPTFKSLDGAEKEAVGDKEYDVIVINDDASSEKFKYFVVPYGDGEYRPEIIERYSGTSLISRMNVNDFSTDYSAYQSVPSGYKSVGITGIANWNMNS